MTDGRPLVEQWDKHLHDLRMNVHSLSKVCASHPGIVANRLSFRPMQSLVMAPKHAALGLYLDTKGIDLNRLHTDKVKTKQCG